MEKDLIHILKFPLEDSEWPKKIVMGSLLLVVPLINIIVLGYLMECMYFGIRSRHHLPDWDNILDFVKAGLVALAILIAFFWVPIVILIWLSFIPFLGIFIASILFLLIGLVVPMVLASFAARQDIRDAFMLGEVVYRLGMVFNDYITAYICFVLSVLLALILIFMVPYLAFVGVLAIFYISVVFFYYIGRLYRLSIHREE